MGSSKDWDMHRRRERVYAHGAEPLNDLTPDYSLGIPRGSPKVTPTRSPLRSTRSRGIKDTAQSGLREISPRNLELRLVAKKKRKPKRKKTTDVQPQSKKRKHKVNKPHKEYSHADVIEFGNKLVDLFKSLIGTAFAHPTFGTAVLCGIHIPKCHSRSVFFDFEVRSEDAVERLEKQMAIKWMKYAQKERMAVVIFDMLVIVDKVHRLRVKRVSRAKFAFRTQYSSLSAKVEKLRRIVAGATPEQMPQPEVRAEEVKGGA